MPSIARFDEQIVVHQIDEILADRRNGILKNFKTPIELRVEPGDLHDAKVGVACIQSRNDPRQGPRASGRPRIRVLRCATP